MWEIGGLIFNAEGSLLGAAASTYSKWKNWFGIGPEAVVELEFPFWVVFVGVC